MALLLIAPNSGAGEEIVLKTDRVVYEYGDTIQVTYAYPIRYPGPKTEINIVETPTLGPLNPPPGQSLLLTSKTWTIDNEASGTISIDTRMLDRKADTQRTRVRIRMPPARPVDVILIRTLHPQPGAITTNGRTSWSVGTQIEAWVTAHVLSHNREGGGPYDTALRVQLVRLGRALPGGSASLDEPLVEYDAQAQTPMPMRLPDTADSTRLPWHPGAYELRLAEGCCNSVLARLPLSIEVPVADQALRLDFEGREVATIEHWPQVNVSLPPGFPAALFEHLRLETHFVGRDGVLEWVGAVALGGGGPTFELPAPRASTLRSGHYQTHLVLITDPGGVRGSSEDPSERYSLASEGFDVRGDIASPKHQAFGDITLTVTSAGPHRPGESLEIRARDAHGAPPGGSHVMALGRKGGLAWNCARRLRADRPGLVPLDAEGNARVTLPVEVGDYEVRLYERPPWRRPFDSIDFREDSLINRVDVPIRLPFLPAALSSTSAERLDPGQELVVRLRLDEHDIAPLGAVLRIARLPNLSPGGAWIPASREWMVVNRLENRDSRLNGSYAPDVTAYCTVRGPEGACEAWLLSATSRLGQVAYGRLPFHVVDRRLPRLPIGAAYTAALEPAWPSPDDPLRGLAANDPPAEVCGRRVVPSSTVRLVELDFRDPLDPDDDAYIPIESLRPGYPFVVEATFQEAPPDDQYTVVVEDRIPVVVRRTEHPLVFRSDLVRLRMGSR